MEQKLFSQCRLLRLTDGGKSWLFKVPENIVTAPSEFAEPFEIEPLPFLPEPQSVLEVYPDANLIVTQDALMTLDGKIIMNNERDKISVLPTAADNEWIIVQDSSHDNDTRYRLIFWNGNRECNCIWGKTLLKNAKYLALFTEHKHCWHVCTYDGTPIMAVENAEAEMKLCGDFLVAEGIGHHSAYTLKPLSKHNANDRCIFKHQQLILCSADQNFAICANLQGAVQTYHNGIYREYGKAEMIELYDRAGLFSVKRGGRFFFYRFNGDKYAENMYPCGADSVAYNQDTNTLLISVNGLFRIHAC